MNASVATERKSFLPLRLRSTTVLLGSNSNIPTASHSTTPVATSMPLTAQNDTKSTLTVGNRVLVNGLKSGILRYIGLVKFARGIFCGVELDEPHGKHDGQVNDIRYFQCKTNHGIFVPQDKVVLATRKRTLITQQTLDPLKPSIMTRSMTVSSSSSTTNNKIEQIPIKISSATTQLPDIIPTASNPIQTTPIIESINDSVMADIREITTPTETIRPILKPQLNVIDEPSETIEVDFTDSVSLFLHQLQQEQNPSSSLPRSPSISISEEDTIDDLDEDDDIDELDNESIAESNNSEKIPSLDPILPINDEIKSIQTNLTIPKTNLLTSRTFSYSNTSLASSTTSSHKLKINPIEKKRKLNIPTPVVKKIPERKLSAPLTNVISTTRKISLVPSPKKQLSYSTKSIVAFGSQSKLNQSPSSSNSVNSSRSDLTSNPKKLSKIISNTTRETFHKKSNSTANVLNDQSMIQQQQQHVLESANKHLKNQYQHLLNQFDLMHILNQYHIDKNEQIKQQYQIKLSKVQIENRQLKTSIEHLQISHKNDLIVLNEQHQNQIQLIKDNHKQESIKYQQEINKLLNEKNELEIRCSSLQDQVNQFMEEMSNSEYADPLLRHVDILEKDRTSLQAVLELRNQELTQLRTRINEQTFQREDQLVLQKRIDMVENRNQDLICLLRNWQLNEIVAAVERDELKKNITQLERDNHRLIFEKETLLYSLRQRSTTISSFLTSNSRPIIKQLDRAHSFSCISTTKIENERLKRSLSLNSIFHR